MGRQAEAACLPRKYHLKIRLESKAAIRVPPSKPQTDERYFESVARYLSTRNKSRDLVSVFIFLPGRQLELARQVKTKYRFCSPFNVFIAKLRAAIGQYSYTWERTSSSN